MILTILIFAIILGLLVFIHEAGHYITARRNGITCHEFGFGFPPRLGGIYKDLETGRWKLILGNKEYYGTSTLYSFNWIPLGGFVRIKGEDGTETDPDAFATQSHWVKFKVLSAGVFMNFVLAWVLIAIVLMMGAPEPVDEHTKTARIVGNPLVQIVDVEDDSPAKEIGIKVGDAIERVCAVGGCREVKSVTDLQIATKEAQGQNVTISVLRGSEELELSGVLRRPQGDAQGSLGVSMAQTAIVQYPWYEALWEGLLRVFGLIVTILFAFGSLVKGLFVGDGVGADISGPVGIAIMTQQMRDLGLAYLLQFSAILSVNLGIINALPIPALDGGRIMFLAIEKLKGRPVNKKTEGIIHSISFLLLIILMVVITARDVLKFF